MCLHQLSGKNYAEVQKSEIRVHKLLYLLMTCAQLPPGYLIHQLALESVRFTR